MADFEGEALEGPVTYLAIVVVLRRPRFECDVDILPFYMRDTKPWQLPSMDWSYEFRLCYKTSASILGLLRVLVV